MRRVRTRARGRESLASPYATVGLWRADRNSVGYVNPLSYGSARGALIRFFLRYDPNPS
jgi:hypothetical protein